MQSKAILRAKFNLQCQRNIKEKKIRYSGDNAMRNTNDEARVRIFRNEGGPITLPTSVISDLSHNCVKHKLTKSC